jgi:hypothetical protein
MHVITIHPDGSVEYNGASLGRLAQPIVTVAKTLLDRGASPDDLVVARGECPTMTPVPLASFLRHRPPPHNFTVPTYYRR